MEANSIPARGKPVLSVELLDTHPAPQLLKNSSRFNALDWVCAEILSRECGLLGE